MITDIQKIRLERIPSDYQFSNLGLNTSDIYLSEVNLDSVVLLDNLNTNKLVEYNTELWTDKSYFKIDKSLVNLDIKVQTQFYTVIKLQDLLNSEEIENLDLPSDTAYVAIAYSLPTVSPRISMVKFTKFELPDLFIVNN